MRLLLRIAPALAGALLCLACTEKPATPDTKETTPAVPQGVKLHSSTETTLTFQWGAVEGAGSYDWILTLEGTSHKTGTVKTRNVQVEGLTAGTTYGFSVRAVSAAGASEFCSPIGATTAGSAPTPPDPSAKTVCVDAPVVIEFPSAPTLGTAGLIRVLKADGTEVDRINLADLSTVDILDDGTMIPKGADADKNLIAIGNDYPFNTFMDALHSANYRIVHYTPLRVEGKSLVIKLHNEALEFGKTYTVKVDASVTGMAAEDVSFTTKAKPGGSTIKVAADGSGDFCTVQGALSYVSSNVPKDDAVTIEVAEGTYRELLYLRGKNNLTLRGASRQNTIIAYPNNESYETGSGASVASRPSLGSSIGKSGGRALWLVETCGNLAIENLTVENTYSIPSHKGQAETIYFNADDKRLTIENCSLVSWQDTFLCKGEVYVHNSLIAGHVDFIWGYPKACLFEDCEIRSRAGGYIVQARVPGASDKGFVFLNCALTAEEGVKAGSAYLARSGGDSSVYDNVTFIGCTMSDVIAPAGWHTGKTPTPATPTATSGWKEYGTKGVSTASRNACGLILTASEAEAYSSRQAVLGW